MGKDHITIRSFLYNTLLKNYTWFNKFRLFYTLWNIATNLRYDVKTKLFGSSVILPSNYSLPIIAREFPEFNNAYLQLVYECYRNKNQRLNIIDVGAGV